MPDPVYAELKWDAVRRQLIVELTQDPIPPDESTAAMQQIDAVFTMQTRIARTGVTELDHLGPPASGPKGACASCTHAPEGHRGTVGEGDPLTWCRVAGCECTEYLP